MKVWTESKKEMKEILEEIFLKEKIHLAPSQFEAMFLSEAHTGEVIHQTLDTVKKYVAGHM